MSVDQDAPSMVPILHPGNISPAVMREFQNGCLDYFDNKHMDEDKQVRKILPGLKDPCIHDWVNTNCICIQALTFDEFMTEFHTVYLDEDWEEKTRQVLLGMTQGAIPFWDYAFTIQSNNSLLNGTPLHLDKEKLCHQLEACMEERLSQKVNSKKVNKIVDFKKWLAEVKVVDENIRANRKEFECIVKASCETGRHTTNALGDPSHCAKSSHTGPNTTRRPTARHMNPTGLSTMSTRVSTSPLPSPFHPPPHPFHTLYHYIHSALPFETPRHPLSW